LNTRHAPHFARLLAMVLATSLGCASDPPNNGNTGGSGGRGGGTGGRGGGPIISPPPMFGTPAGRIEDGPFMCTSDAAAGAITFEKIGEWRDDASAAYTIIHDDACGPELRGIDMVAVPALDMRNIKASLGPFIQVCEEAGLWDMVRDLQAKGHEIINHSYTHANVRPANAVKEVMMAKATFDSKLMQPVTFFIFPFDDFSTETVNLVKMAGHLGARAGIRDDNDGFDNPPINLPGMDNDMNLEFDAWPRAYSKYTSFPEKDLLNLHVHNAIEKKGFAVREFHSVSTKDVAPLSGEGFGPVPLKTYEAHLDFLYYAWKANKVWTSTASTIIRYRQAHKACTATVSDTAITFNTSNPKCTEYATPISVIVNTANEVPGLKAVQGTNPVAVRKLGPKRFSVTADPTKGNVTIGGCGNEPPTVDGAVPLAAKPMPVASVCELEQVKGKGTPGTMDNLERSMANLQILPNPSQGDGRNGSWSWYPQTVTVGIHQETPTNKVLKYSGGGLKAWTGATLAFLGGNGSGTCYDATAYKGIRFKVKGSVNAPTDTLLNGRVAVSLITAETQIQKYGGDLRDPSGMGGGHFNFFAPVTAEWATIELTWDKLQRPTWGATTGLMMPALTKLQAIDFGISDKADTFEIFLDDIELF
jgi:hypothetical protein